MTRTYPAKTGRFLSLILVGLQVFLLSLHTQSVASGADPVCVTDFLPSGFVTDGSVSYQAQIQEAIDTAAKSGGSIVFAPMTYRIDDPTGLRVHSNLALRLGNATFVLDEQCDTDGQLFHGHDVVNVSFHGGTIIGRNDVWPAGVNIRGLYLTGASRNIRIHDMQLKDLSSNGIGIFGTSADQPARDIRIIDTIAEHCCNQYGDYRAKSNRGPEKGSEREDQGLIAFYHVHDFAVRGCRLEDSRSDGTHFCFCQRGTFNDNFVYRAKMGGYFLESCQHVLAANNIIRDNGSRGVTIERGSEFCTLNGNTISGSGREGLWIPDSLRCVITNNLFSLNGRKVNGEQRHTLWNANLTINQARGDKLNTPTAHYLIADNIIETDAHQIAAIRVDTREETRDILIQDNLFFGPNRKILVEGPDQQAVTVVGNQNAEPERVEHDE